MKNIIALAFVTGLIGPAALAQGGEGRSDRRSDDPRAKAAAQEPQEAKDQKGKKMKDGAVEPGMAIDQSITLADLDGKSHTLSDHAGKIVVIDFWSTQCPVSRRYDEARTQLHDEYAKQGVVFFAVDPDAGDVDDKNADPYHKIRAYLKDNPVPWTVCVDQGNVIADRLGAKVTPQLFIVDKKGVVRYVGAYDDNKMGTLKAGVEKPYVRQAIDALLNDQEPPVASTEPFGCPIKRGGGVKPQPVDASGERPKDLKPGDLQKGREPGLEKKGAAGGTKGNDDGPSDR